MPPSPIGDAGGLHDSWFDSSTEGVFTRGSRRGAQIGLKWPHVRHFRGNFELSFRHEPSSLVNESEANFQVSPCLT